MYLSLGEAPSEKQGGLKHNLRPQGDRDLFRKKKLTQNN